MTGFISQDSVSAAATEIMKTADGSIYTTDIVGALDSYTGVR